MLVSSKKIFNLQRIECGIEERNRSANSSPIFAASIPKSLLASLARHFHFRSYRLMAPAQTEEPEAVAVTHARIMTLGSAESYFSSLAPGQSSYAAPLGTYVALSFKYRRQAVDNHTRRVSDRKRNSEVNNLETSNLRWQLDQPDCLLCHLTEV